MLNALAHLNYVAVFVTALAGFSVGWLWFSPVLFAKAWMTEMKLTPERVQAGGYNMWKIFGTSFVVTVISSLGLAVLIAAVGTTGALNGAALGAWVGALVVGTRMINGGLWELRSARLNAICVGHEVVMFTVQGAILGVWR